MRIAHNPELLDTLRTPSMDAPWHLLVSGCLAGLPCGVDGTDYGAGGCLRDFTEAPTVRSFSFCPEHHGIGTPRSMPDIHGGDGFDVIEGRARVMDEHGTDLTEQMLAGAEAMLHYARENDVELAILMDMSAACGTQVISKGCRLVEEREYQLGVGVAAALLIRADIPVVSQRDYHSLGRLRAILDPGFVPEPSALDHHQTPWVREYFGA